MNGTLLGRETNRAAPPKRRKRRIFGHRSTAKAWHRAWREWKHLSEAEGETLVSPLAYWQASLPALPV
jgi:hypothetical protein